MHVSLEAIVVVNAMQNTGLKSIRHERERVYEAREEPRHC